MLPNKFDYIFVISHSLTVVMHFRFFCNNYKSNISTKLIYHLNSRSEVHGKHKSPTMASLISGSMPAHSCVHFEHDMQQTHLSPLAEFKKVSRQKIHSSSSSSFVSLLPFFPHTFLCVADIFSANMLFVIFYVYSSILQVVF
jgi:hypothetical protein